jgi:hypothetical protein
MLKTPKRRESLEIFAQPPYRRGMITIISALVSVLSFRFRRRAPSNLSSSPFDINSPCCGGSAQVGLGSSLQIDCSGCGFTGFGRGP